MITEQIKFRLVGKTLRLHFLDRCYTVGVIQDVEYVPVLKMYTIVTDNGDYKTLTKDHFMELYKNGVEKNDITNRGWYEIME